MWVKFKKGHPAYGYFVGDVAEIKDEEIESIGLNEKGFTIPATKKETDEAKEAIAAENLADPELLPGIPGLQQKIALQNIEIAQLKASVEAKAPVK